jgi:hypothetical protein
VIVSAFEMQIQLRGTEYLTDDAKFWQAEQRFDTLEIDKHGFLLLGV